MNDLSEDIERLHKDLRALEQHLEALDHRLERVESRVGAPDDPAIARWPDPSTNVEATVSTLTSAVESSAQAGSLFPVLGKALLGIAGAYVLRAIEESSPVPRLIVAVAGILYAFLWLIGAARVRKEPRVTSSIYAGTAALILAPMLWELTLRFNVLSPAVAAVVVCAFALAAFVLCIHAPASERALKPVVRVTSFAAAALALALAIASHTLLPFVVVLLLLTAACEFVPGCDRLPDVAALFALAADALIWCLIYVYFAGPAAHEEFPALTRGALLVPGLTIFVVFAVSAGVKTVLRARQITAFDTLQTILAFLLAAVTLADFAQPYGLAILGVACLVLSAAGYATVFTVFARAPEVRNMNVFAAWSTALLLAGSFLCLPRFASLAVFAAAALASTWLSRQERWASFAFYGMMLLLAASAASGLLTFLADALAGTPGGASAPGVWSIAMCAVMCYAIAPPREVAGWIQTILRLGFAALAAGVVMALFFDGLVALTSLRVIPGAHHLALIRTIVLCAAALALVFGGARWLRRELTWLGYTALVLVAVKLVAEDMRHGHLAYVAASIFLIAFTLIAAPRAARAFQKS